MCILAIGVECHPDWPLVVVHNRDEEWCRSTDPPQSHDGVIYARDAVAGGTWMGLNSASGAFAALTNVRSASARPVGGPSRGALVLHALERPGDETAAVAEQYSSFNLWHGSAFAGGSAQVTRSRFRARSEEGGIAEVSGAWVADTLPVAPGEVAAHSNEGDTACGDEPWAKTRGEGGRFAAPQLCKPYLLLTTTYYYLLLTANAPGRSSTYTRATTRGSAPRGSRGSARASATRSTKTSCRLR